MGFGAEKVEEDILEYDEDTIEEESTNITTVAGNKTIEKRDANENEGQILDELHFDDVMLMYDLCRYERARNPNSISVWCAVFDQEDLMVRHETPYVLNNATSFLSIFSACPPSFKLLPTALSAM